MESVFVFYLAIYLVTTLGSFAGTQGASVVVAWCVPGVSPVSACAVGPSVTCAESRPRCPSPDMLT